MSDDSEKYAEIYKRYHTGHTHPSHIDAEIRLLKKAGISPEEYEQRILKINEMLETGEIDYDYLLRKGKNN